MKRLLLLVALGRLTMANVEAQINLAGRVTDAKQQPLSNATLSIRGADVGTTTKTDGQFSLLTQHDLPLILVVSLVGYKSQEVQVRGNNFRSVLVTLKEKSVSKDTNRFVPTNDFVLATSRVPVPVQRAPVTVEKIGSAQFEQSPVLSPYDVLQSVKGVDFLTQSLTNKTVNLRGFGATNNTRLVQLTDGMDNRSPGLGYGFGNIAGLPDLDVERIELVPGASSALYGPDAEQGLVSLISKNPFLYQGLSVQLKGGVNNVGKANFGPKGYGEIGIRYAKQLGDRLAFKINFQRLSGTDFIADDYNDRQTRTRATGMGYVPNNNASTNFQYDGVNSYGDENSGNASAYAFPADYANVLLQNRLVTRTGYTEIDLVGNQGKVFNNRANASLHYKLADNIEASVGWYYGNGNFINTTNFRNYFPNYQRHQFKAEIRGDNFFLRAYTTQQKAEAWNIGQTALALNNSWKSIGQWAAEFGQAYVENKFSAGESRATADRGRYLPGSAQFSTTRDAFANTFNTDSVIGYRGARGTRFRDNSTLWHYEGMYNVTELLPIAEVLVGGSIRHYRLNTGGTVVALQADGSEYTINEYGAYVQVAREAHLGDNITIKPTVALRYDKNQYIEGGLSPRVSAVVSIGPHHFRGSWQTAFHNPTPEQLFAIPTVGNAGEVGGLPSIVESVSLLTAPAYAEKDVLAFTGGRISEGQLQSRVYVPSAFKRETLKTWEVGYKTVLKNKLAVDAYYFHSQYTNFITTQTFYQPINSQFTNFSAGSYRTLQINGNSANDIFVNGWGAGLDYAIVKGFTLSGNFTHQVGTITLRDALGAVINDNAGNPIVNLRMSNPVVIQQGRNYFNSPENRYNVSLANAHLTERIGATVTYRWTDKMWYEQGITAGDVWLPSWTSLDAQMSYKVPTYKALVKVGGTNLLNKYYAQGYGLAQIGGLYYVSITFDELMR